MKTYEHAEQLAAALRETTDLLEAWWKCAGSPVHATEPALSDAGNALAAWDKHNGQVTGN